MAEHLITEPPTSTAPRSAIGCDLDEVLGISFSEEVPGSIGVGSSACEETR